MGLNIKNSTTETVIRELAEATGEKLTVAVHNAVTEKLERLKRGKARQPLAEYLTTLGALQEALAAKALSGKVGTGFPSESATIQESKKRPWVKQ